MTTKTSEKQKLFNKAVKGLASQDFKRSVNRYGTCLYRGPAGRRCAVGWLIPDAEYSASMEDKNAAAIGLFEDAVGPFLVHLQDVHDAADDSRDLKKGLIQFAKAYNLKLPKALQ